MLMLNWSLLLVHHHALTSSICHAGNGYPVAGLVVSKELARAFSMGGMEYFNTYGGSTAACTAALATLRVVRSEGLQQHAAKVRGSNCKGSRNQGSGCRGGWGKRANGANVPMRRTCLGEG